MWVVLLPSATRLIWGVTVKPNTGLCNHVGRTKKLEFLSLLNWLQSETAKDTTMFGSQAEHELMRPVPGKAILDPPFRVYPEVSGENLLQVAGVIV